MVGAHLLLVVGRQTRSPPAPAPRTPATAAAPGSRRRGPGRSRPGRRRHRRSTGCGSTRTPAPSPAPTTSRTTRGRPADADDRSLGWRPGCVTGLVVARGGRPVARLGPSPGCRPSPSSSSSSSSCEQTGPREPGTGGMSRSARPRARRWPRPPATAVSARATASLTVTEPPSAGTASDLGDDVGQDHGDVVDAAGGEGSVDQSVTAIVEIGMSGERRAIRRVVDQAAHAVAAEQQPVTRLQLAPR